MRFARRARTAAAGNAQPCFASEMPGARGASFDCRPRSGAPETSSTAQARTAGRAHRRAPVIHFQVAFLIIGLVEGLDVVRWAV